MSFVSTHETSEVSDQVRQLSDTSSGSLGSLNLVDLLEGKSIQTTNVSETTPRANDRLFDFAKNSPWLRASLDGSKKPSDGPQTPTETPPPPKDIDWIPDVFDAFQKALRENKPLIVEFSTEGCEHCKRLDEQTMKSLQVKELAQRAVWSRVDPVKDDPSGNVSRMIQSLGITHYPTVVVLDVSSQQLREMGRIVGFFEPAKFSEHVKAILPKNSSSMPNEIAQRKVS